MDRADMEATADLPHFYEIWYWRFQIILVLIIATTAVFGGCQLFMLQNQSRAQFLLELDRRFEDIEMRECRAEIEKLNREMNDEINGAHAYLTDNAKIDKIRALSVEKIRDFRVNDRDRFTKLMRLANFFETVGLTVKQKYVSLDDIDRLFRGPILHVDKFLRGFINEWQNEMGMPNGLYEHALFLADEIAKRNR
jgi:hypothetical protein